MTDLQIVRDVVVAEQSPIVHLPSAKELMSRDADMSDRRDQAEQHHYKSVWAKEPHTSSYYKVDSSQQSEDSTSETAGEVQSFGPTSNVVGNHMTKGAGQLIEQELKSTFKIRKAHQGRPEMTRSSLELPAHRIQSCPDQPAQLDSMLQDPGCEHYTWFDQGDKVVIQINMLQLGSGKPFVKVEFGYQTVGIEVSYLGRLRYKLKIPKLFAPVSWDLCRWAIQNDILSIELVKLRADQEWRKLHARMIFERVVPLHSVSESIVQLGKFQLLAAEPHLFSRSNSTAYIMSLFHNKIDDDDNEVQDDDDSDVKNQYDNALELIRVGKYIEALTCLENLVGCLHMEHNMLRFVILKLAECHKQNGNFKRAMDCLCWIIQRHQCETAVEALLMRASLYEQTERGSLAVLDAKMALMFDRQNQVAQGILRRLQNRG